jgi:hypothetical protein
VTIFLSTTSEGGEEKEYAKRKHRKRQGRK